MSKRSVKRRLGLFLLVLAIAAGVLAYAFSLKLRPLALGPPQLIRYNGRQPLSSVLHDLEVRHVVRSAAATGFYARLRKGPAIIETGTYSVRPGMTADDILKALVTPVSTRVTIPEYYWIAQTAELLEREKIATAQEYEDLASKPKSFSKFIDYPMPQNSLEGYLFPDTYKMQPLVGARAAIEQQLEAFQKKVWIPLGKPKNLRKILIVASMVEREAKLDAERPIIAGLIENRLAKGMPLEVDATILYAQQRWHVPTRADIRNTISPYNTYLNKGLPPGPICSPGLKSIRAALKPAHTDYLYYVAMPDGHSLFAKTFDQHKANVAKRKRAMRRAQRG